MTRRRSRSNSPLPMEVSRPAISRRCTSTALRWNSNSQERWEDALQSFSRAAELDPNFARAYAGMAAAAGNLDQMQNAEKYAKLAMEHVDRMTERERYRVRGQYYIRTENWQKCVEEYSDVGEAISG